MKRPKYLAIALMVISFVILAYNISVLWPFTADDSFIAFRYAENLALGHGPTFNAGQAPVEGYTCFLWILIMAIPHFFGMEPVCFAKCAGVVFTLMYQFVAFRLAAQLSEGPSKWGRYFVGSMVVLMLSAHLGTAVHAVSGMETALYAFLITVFFFLIVKYLSSPTRRLAIVVVLVGLLLGLARAEGNLIVVLGLAVTLVLLPREQKTVLVTAIVLFYILPGCVYFLWRASYYGQLLPLPFYIKVSKQGLLSGVGPVAVFLVFVGKRVGILVLLGLLKSNRKLLPLFASCLGLVLFFCFPRHMMGYQHRFLFPILPFILVIAAIGIYVLQQLLQCSAGVVTRRHHLLTLILLAIYAVVPLGIAADGYQRTRTSCVRYYEGLKKTHIALGKRLRDVGAAESPGVLAIADAGAVPYYSKWRTIDTAGLNDAHIATSGKHDPQYVMAHDPDVVVLISYRRDELVFRPGTETEWRRDLYQCCLQRGMVRVAILEFHPGYYLWVMAVPGSPIARGLENWK